ncbi:MAG: hypothetical protein ACE5Z5_06960 [Candidatus Bathyarchaeia archaeon]
MSERFKSKSEEAEERIYETHHVYLGDWRGEGGRTYEKLLDWIEKHKDMIAERDVKMTFKQIPRAGIYSTSSSIWTPERASNWAWLIVEGSGEGWNTLRETLKREGFEFRGSWITW